MKTYRVYVRLARTWKLVAKVEGNSKNDAWKAALNNVVSLMGVHNMGASLTKCEWASGSFHNVTYTRDAMLKLDDEK